MNSRIRAFLLIPVAALVGLPTPLRSAELSERRMAFQILRDGAPFGVHRLTFDREGERLMVTNEIEAQVKMGGLTLFRYRHDSHEVWKNGQIVSVSAMTDDDGALTQFNARQTAAGLMVEGSAGQFLAPSDTAPLALWRKDVVERQHLLELTTGEVISVQPTRLGSPDIDAERWRLGGDLDLELVYAPDGRLLASRFKARGSVFEYQPLDEQVAQAMRP